MSEALKRLLPEPMRAWTRRLRADLIARLARRTNLTREPLSHIFLSGHGIEIGALNNPLSVPSRARALRVDRLSRQELIKLYIDVDPSSIPETDIIAGAETLEGIEDESQDFVIANHVVEHVEDPIAAIRHMLRVLRENGFLFLTLPDKRFSFDEKRRAVTFEEVKTDYQKGPEGSRLEHYRDWLENVDKSVDKSELEARAKDMERDQANIHFHAWDQAAMMEMLARMQSELDFEFDVECMSRTGLEVIFVIRKTGPVPAAPVR